MWIFGYGSLVWKADFPYIKKIIGYIKGYERKFWQASIDHRGVPGNPGRVVTLIPSSDPEAQVWGIAYELDNAEADKNSTTLQELDTREKRFEKIFLLFHPVVDITCHSVTSPLSVPTDTETSSSDDKLPTCQVMAYIARPDGPLFLGEATVEAIARQVSEAVGPYGLTNSEYIFKLAEFMRTYLPTIEDSHLFSIERELLVLSRKAKVYGAAYKIHRRDIEEVVRHLDLREVGGYEKTPVEFYPLPNHKLNLYDVHSSTSISVESNSSESPDIIKGESMSTNGEGSLVRPKPSKSNGFHVNGSTTTAAENGQTNSYSGELSESEDDVEEYILGAQVPDGHFRVTMYYGNSENAHYIGPASIDEMAVQIYGAVGKSGPNKEYLYNLFDVMRQISEEASDSHLSELETRVRTLDMTMNRRKSGRSTPIEL